MSINDITGDKLISKPNTKEYEDGWERIYGNSHPVMVDEDNNGFEGLDEQSNPQIS